MLTNEVNYFDSFGVEHIPKEIKKFISNKNIKANIYRVQANDTIMCGYFCIGFIDFMLAGKTLIDYTNLFSAHNFDILVILKMDEINKSGLSEQTKFRLSEIPRD